MLGHVRRTSRLDIALALIFSGAAYLVWALVAGFSRQLVSAMLLATDGTENAAMVTKVVKVVFLDAGIAIDLVGLVWLVGSLALVLLSSRQKISISWAWLSSISQSCFAALGAVLVGWGVNASQFITSTIVDGDKPLLQKLSAISLGVTVTLAVVFWAGVLVWLLVQRARFNSNRRPSLRDGLRSSFFPSRR